MKRIGLLLLLSVTLSFLTACEHTDPTSESLVNKLTFSADDFILLDDTPQTKTSIVDNTTFIWTQNDTVGIYPNTGSQVFFEMTSGAGAGNAEFDGGGWAFKASSVYYSYYPFIGDIYLDRNHIPVVFTGQKQPSTASTAHIGPYDYMYTDPTSSVEGGDLHFTYHHLCCIIRPNVTLPAGTWTKLAVTAPSKVFALEGYYDLMAELPVIIPTKTSSQIQIDMDNIVLTEETTFRIFIMSAPVSLKDVEITVSVRNSQGQEYQCKKTPTRNYPAGSIGGLTCNTWTEAPMSLIIDDWEDGGTISGTAE
ncbi:MAG: hypothetical protein IKX71_07825 [Bacteroidales bacterium]|nr:hypothetical protein [Bacteroidales bacterium]